MVSKTYVQIKSEHLHMTRNKNQLFEILRGKTYQKLSENKVP